MDGNGSQNLMNHRNVGSWGVGIGSLEMWKEEEAKEPPKAKNTILYI